MRLIVALGSDEGLKLELLGLSDLCCGSSLKFSCSFRANRRGIRLGLYHPTPPNVALLRALWSLLDGISGILKGGWGVLDDVGVEAKLGSYAGNEGVWSFRPKIFHKSQCRAVLVLRGVGKVWSKVLSSQV